MNVQDWETFARYHAPIVWGDGVYGLIGWKASSRAGGRHVDLAFNNRDFERLAKSSEIGGREVRGARDFAPALDGALAHKGPTLLAVNVDDQKNRKLAKRLGDLEFTR